LRDGTTNLLFVGRWVPNKRIEDLLRVFAFYHHKLNANSRLLVVGSSWLPNYNRELLGEIRRLGLSGKVLFPGGGRGVSDPDLVSYYRSADAFVIMSEHEGFCVPLVESMFFGVPIFAYAAGAVPETLGGSGVLVSRKVFPVIALAIEEVLENRVLRSAVVGKEKERLEDLSQGRIEERLWEYLQPFL
jgi:glycosyltransferase involved in cell wall biosynthesis